MTFSNEGVQTVLDGDLQTPEELRATANTAAARRCVRDGSLGTARTSASFSFRASSEAPPLAGSIHGTITAPSKWQDKADLKSEESTMDSEATVTSPPIGREVRVSAWKRWPLECVRVLRTFCQFIGPGFMISVAYIDPGNYATDVEAGAKFRFKLLSMILISNIFASFLQSLCVHMATVTGMNLSQMIKTHCPPWLNYASFFFGYCAIIATDIAEVIGSAVAINLLSHGKIPLVAGCAISIVDVFFILLFYRNSGASMKAKRVFEIFVAILVVGVIICFCIMLSFTKGLTAREVLHGYVPSETLVQSQGLYAACGILGATVMPHSIYLGSGLPQARLMQFDKANNLLATPIDNDNVNSAKGGEQYRPSIQAIKSCRWYAIVDNVISLSVFALFVNSAILIVAGASLSNIKGAADASLFAVYDLFSQTLAPAAAEIFAVALLLSGLSAGIVCTIAGQMMWEGQLEMDIKPWKQRLMTRSISIVPSIIVAGVLGGPGVTKALVGSQVALSVILPFVITPLVYFTCRAKYMTVTDNQHLHNSTEDESGIDISGDGDGVQQPDVSGHEDCNGVRIEEEQAQATKINMRVHPVVAFIGLVIWGIIVIMNVALLVLQGLGHT